MTYAMIIVFLISIAGAKPVLDREIGPEYISREATTCINGVFVMLIIISHYSNCHLFSWDPVLEGAYLTFRRHTDQLVVATFLFYSGYGMENRIYSKGWDYISEIPTKFTKLLFRFDFAVLLFLIVQTILGEKFPLKTILLAFIAWGSIGNSSWYIFVILVMYILLFISYSAMRPLTKEVASVMNALAFLGMVILFIIAMIKAEWPAYYYNTAILLPLGGLYALSEKRIRAFLNRSPFLYLIAITLAVEAYIFFFLHRQDSTVMYIFWTIAFMSLVLLFTMRVRIGNRVLAFFGRHVFSIYIIQRIPLLILGYMGVIESHKYIGLCITVISTIILALAFEKVTDKMWNKLRLEKK